VWRVEVGYFGATAVLCVLLWLLYRRGSAGALSSADRPRRGVRSPRRLRRDEMLRLGRFWSRKRPIECTNW
jgi:hypothetical protein